MGNSQSHKRNVRERHTRALYINIPISESIKSLLIANSPRVHISITSNQSYLSIVVDDLCELSSWVGVGFLPTPMSGWMMKFNLLVDVEMHQDTSNKENSFMQPSYQILTLDFERSIGGKVKQLGAIVTQKIPSYTSLFDMSCGRSGYSVNKPMIEDNSYSAHVSTLNGDCLLKLNGTLKELTTQEKLFAKFIVERPHKVLFQNNGTNPVHAPEDGEGADFTSDGMMRVHLSERIQLPMVKERIKELSLMNLKSKVATLSQGSADSQSTDLLDESSIAKLIDEFEIDDDKVIVLLQPEYTLVDHTNVNL